MFCQRMSECVHKQLNKKAFLVTDGAWTRYDAVTDTYQKPQERGPDLSLITQRITQAYLAEQDAYVTLHTENDELLKTYEEKHWTTPLPHGYKTMIIRTNRRH